MKIQKIRFHGRGGQGTVIASILAGIAFLVEKIKLITDIALLIKKIKLITMPEFGVERRGAPVKAYLYLGTTTPRYAIHEPDSVVVLDETLVGPDVVSGLKKNGIIIINSAKRPEDFFYLGPFTIGVVDATAISCEHKIGTKANPVVNTAMLGAMAKLLKIFKLEGLIQAISTAKDIPTKKIGDNIATAKKAFDQTLAKKSTVRQHLNAPIASSANAPALSKEFIQLTKEISISFEDTTKNETGSWRSIRPVIDQEKCKSRGLKCGLCDVCPDLSVIIDKESGRVDINYDYCKGCGLCAEACPLKAITMIPETEARKKNEK